MLFGDSVTSSVEKLGVTYRLIGDLGSTVRDFWARNG
jgi:hypothetical protein